MLCEDRDRESLEVLLELSRDDEESEHQFF